MNHQDDHPLELLRKLTVNNLSFTYIDESSIHGFGLFAEADIPKGTLLGVLDGQVMEWDHYDEIVENFRQEIGSAAQYLFMEWNALSETVLLVRPFRTSYSFINHSRTPNLVILRNPLRIVSLRDIQAREELLLDYRREPLRERYLEGHGKAFL